MMTIFRKDLIFATRGYGINAFRDICYVVMWWRVQDLAVITARF